jgi:hypothetical protein
VERDKPKKSESVGQTLPQLPGNKKGHMIFLQGFIKFDQGIIGFKMATIANQNGRHLVQHVTRRNFG